MNTSYRKVKFTKQFEYRSLSKKEAFSIDENTTAISTPREDGKLYLENFNPQVFRGKGTKVKFCIAPPDYVEFIEDLT
jgi:hypothetical protein